MTAELKSTSEGRTMVLTIANPTQRNALGPEIYAPASRRINGAESSGDRSVVIVGEGACSAPAARCSGCRPTASAIPRCRPRRHRGPA